jgi:L-fuculose-phosphate aldolase
MHLATLSIPELICDAARLMFERKLTDMSGGNLSARDGSGGMYITPRYAGSKQHWNLEPADLLQVDIESDEILDNPRCSRETRMHLAVYRHYPEVQAVIHAHPFHVLPFVVAEKPIPAVLESTQKFESIELVPFAPAHSQDLADNVVAGLRARAASIRKQAAAVLLPRHGIVVAGKDVLNTVDALERLDWQAWCVLAGRFLQ